jgi:putative Ca2+/H+ antiporter (TMEM165/GDT1 family)
MAWRTGYKAVRRARARSPTPAADREDPMEAFLISLSSIAIAEMGDRTQLLALVLAARFRKPWPVLGGILAAVLLNHLGAALLGIGLGRLLTPVVIDATVGISMIVMALWTLKPEKPHKSGAGPSHASAFTTTFVAFFLAELGDKTQITTMALAAAYANLPAVVAGTTVGMLLASAPVVFLGGKFADRLPLKAIQIGASVLFLVLGGVFLWRAFHHGG